MESVYWPLVLSVKIAEQRRYIHKQLKYSAPFEMESWKSWNFQLEVRLPTCTNIVSVNSRKTEEPAMCTTTVVYLSLVRQANPEPNLFINMLRRHAVASCCSSGGNDKKDRRKG